MLRGAVLVCCVAACDSTFSLVPLIDPPDAGVSNPDADPACWDPTQTRDEDADGIEDGCDLCPADPKVQLADADADLVDDACDPRPGLAGDTVGDFDGFGIDAGWEDQSGTWIAGGGELSTKSDTVIAKTERTTAVVKYPTLDAVFSGDAGIGLDVYLAPANEHLNCMHVMGSSPTPDRVVLTVGTKPAEQADLDTGSGPGRIRLQVDTGGVVSCRLIRGGASMTLTSANTVVGTTTTRVGVISRNAITAFASVTLFGHD
jgi:hypothetical protein